MGNEDCGLEIQIKIDMLFKCVGEAEDNPPLRRSGRRVVHAGLTAWGPEGLSALHPCLSSSAAV
jgi:hypothetical protein